MEFRQFASPFIEISSCVALEDAKTANLQFSPKLIRNRRSFTPLTIAARRHSSEILMSDSLNDRGKAIEDVFFNARDQDLIQKLKQEMAASEAREAMTLASGIDDDAVLDSLISCGITPESMASVALIPLVAVAWADNKMEDNEKEAILKAANEAGVAEGSASFQSIAAWLDNRPDASLTEAWKDYMTALNESIDPVAFNQLKALVMRRAENVAEAAGGFLGLGNKVSDAERKVIDDLGS
jgi:hypothetical protein